MNYNSMYLNNRTPSQNSIFNSPPFKTQSLSKRYNSNSNSIYTRFIPVKNSFSNYNSQTYAPGSRYSQNYEFSPGPKTISKNSLERKTYQNDNNENRSKINERNFSTINPKTFLNQSKNFNHVTLNNKKICQQLNNFYKKRNESEYSSSASLVSEVENDDEKKTYTFSNIKNDKKTHVPISFIEYKKNTSSLQKGDFLKKNGDNSISTESLVKSKMYSKNDYDNHHYVYNNYQLNSTNIYNEKKEPKNYDQITSKLNSILDDSKNGEGKKSDLSYNKFSYYNRLEEEYSSDDSVDKLSTNLEGLKNFFTKPTSLYYDSGIGADVSNSTYTKALNQSDTKKNETKCLMYSDLIFKTVNVKKTDSSKTLNGSTVRNIIKNNDEISSSSVSSSSSQFSSSNSSTAKTRNRIDPKFKSMNLKNSIKYETNNQRIVSRENSKKIDLPIINLNDLTRDLSEKKINNNFSKLTPINVNGNQADFTPHLLNRHNVIRNSKTLVRNLRIPPLPNINYNNVKEIQNQNNELNRNSHELTNRNQDAYKPTYFASDINMAKYDENSGIFKNTKVDERNSVSNNQLSSLISNNAIKIFDKNSFSEKLKTSSTKEQKCVAIKDFVGLYSENLSLTKGEKYTLLNKSSDNWCYIRDKNGNIGYVPQNCIELITEESESNFISNQQSHIGKDWFHGNITRSEAYSLLVGNQNFGGAFLVRNNSTEKGKFTLCIYKNGKVYNYKINFDDLQYFIDQKYKFNSLVELIEFYQKNQAGLISNLKYPAEKNFIDKKTLLESLETIYNRFIIDRKDIEFHEKIGSGQFGIVLKADFKQRKVVAVKKMKPGSKEDEMNFNREAEFMMKLQNLQTFSHRNLVQLFGLSKDYDDSILIVTEFVRFGSLYNYLLKNKERVISSKNRFTRLMNICIDVCDGMQYLESKNIIHRDLATRNCLVGEGEVIKVADFGLARFTDDCYIAHPQSQFPVKWSAPEVIKYRSYSTKSDVWSFSCLMFEVFTLGKMPYGGSTANSVAAKQIISGVIPEKPIYCSNKLYDNIIARAWSKDPKDRPTFKELFKMLESYT